MTLVHHELCFGCGRTNLFGLLFEADTADPDAGADLQALAGRCFIKQDHQGPQRGYAHAGIVATALIEAMAFVCGEDVVLHSLELELQGDVPVGSFLTIEARLEGRGRDTVTATATAGSDSDYFCSARGSFRPWRSISSTRS